MISLLSSPLIRAQETETAPVAGPPVHTGRDRATGSASRATGAIYELGTAVRLVVPAGLPIGSRTFTFAESRARLRAAEVAEGFSAIGKGYSFDGAIDATRAPLELSVAIRNFRMQPGKRLVLAIETPGACDAVHTTTLVGPLCSTWQLLDARYDENAARLLATIPTPNGYRMQFGWVTQD
jgi:hypothetical protein